MQFLQSTQGNLASLNSIKFDTGKINYEASVCLLLEKKKYMYGQKYVYIKEVLILACINSTYKMK